MNPIENLQTTYDESLKMSLKVKKRDQPFGKDWKDPVKGFKDC